MIVEMPFVYDAKLVPPRARNARTVFVIDTLPLNIRELAADEFPVAARYASHRDADHGVQPTDIRSDGRRFYMPDTDVSLTADQLEARARRHEETPLDHQLRLYIMRGHWREQGVTPRAELQGRVESDDRQERIAAIIAAAGEFVVSDNRLYRVCGEPCYQRRQGGWIYEVVLAWPKLVAEHPGQLWRADRLEEHIKEHVLSEHGQRPEIWGSLEILRPDLLRLSVEAVNLRKEAAYAVEALGQRLASDIQTLTRERFDLFATLRDAVKAAPEGEITDELAVALREAIDHLTPNTGLQHRLTEAYERWRRDLVRDADAAVQALPGGLERL